MAEIKVGDWVRVNPVHIPDLVNGELYIGWSAPVRSIAPRPNSEDDLIAISQYDLPATWEWFPRHVLEKVGD